MNKEAFTLEYELTAQDYIDFNLYHLKYSGKIKNLLFIQRFVMPLIYFVLAFILARSTNVPLWVWMIVSAAVYLLWVFVYPARMEKNLSKKLSKALKQEKNSKLLGRHSITLYGDGLTDTGNGGETRVKWSSIMDFVNYKEHLFIFINESRAFIIPKRAFASEDALNSFTSRVEKERAVN